MKIRDLKTYVVGNPPPHFGGRYFLFVKLTTDDDVSGLGEVYCEWAANEKVALEAAIGGFERNGR